MNLAYLAGLFDGEGCVNFSRCRASVYPRVSIINTDLELLIDIQRVFKGSISKHKTHLGWKQGWSWSLHWSKAVSFLEQIEPWLRVKDQQATTVFAWNAIRPKSRHGVTSEYIETVELLVARMHFLNKKGTHDEVDPIYLVEGVGECNN